MVRVIPIGFQVVRVMSRCMDYQSSSRSSIIVDWFRDKGEAQNIPWCTRSAFCVQSAFNKQPARRRTATRSEKMRNCTCSITLLSQYEHARIGRSVGDCTRAKAPELTRPQSCCYHFSPCCVLPCHLARQDPTQHGGRPYADTFNRYEEVPHHGCKGRDYRGRGGARPRAHGIRVRCSACAE